ARNCADSVSCTVDSCNEAQDRCDHNPNNALCNDNNVCTDDVCHVTLDCQYKNNNNPCSDGQWCTVNDQCAGGSCHSGAARDCSDIVGCTDDSCNEAQDRCDHDPNDALCNDNDVCTADSCHVTLDCLYMDIPNDCGSFECGDSPSGCYYCGICPPGEICVEGYCQSDCTDNDDDGYSIEGGVCGPVDCNDNNPNIYPGTVQTQPCGTGVCSGERSNICLPDGTYTSWSECSSYGDTCAAAFAQYGCPWGHEFGDDTGVRYTTYACDVDGICVDDTGSWQVDETCTEDEFCYWDGLGNGDANYYCAWEGLNCTDDDNDGFSIEGGVCGPIDCDDNNPNIYPGTTQSQSCGTGLCAGTMSNVCLPDGTYTFWSACSTEGDVCAAAVVEYSCPWGSDPDDDTGLRYTTYACNDVGSCVGSTGPWQVDETCTVEEYCYYNGQGNADENYWCEPIGPNCIDADGDGYNGTGSVEECGPWDCDDTRTDVYPGAPELCDGVDNDCDGIIDEGCFLNVTSIECFPRVIVGNNQSCTVHVEDDFGNPVTDAHVTIWYYPDDAQFNNCITDHITGACEAKDLQEVVGNFTVYATAVKEGLYSDLDTYPRYSYEVWERRYDIVDLAVYNESTYNDEDYDFFRGEDMFVSFSVIDLWNSNITNVGVVTEMVLVSPPGGRVGLYEFRPHDETTFYYALTPIPLTHDFLGMSQIFTFAFNFTDNTGGQYQADVMIRNNPPEIIPPVEDVNLSFRDGIVSSVIDLSQHEFDLEDSGSDLSWTVFEQSDSFDALLAGKTLTVNAVQEGSGQMTLRLYDLDMDYDEQVVNVFVGGYNKPPQVILVTPECGDVVWGTVDITWLATDPDNDDVLKIKLEYSADQDIWKTIADNEENDGLYVWNVSDIYPGHYWVRITATDGELSASDMTDCQITILHGPDTQCTVQIVADPLSGDAPLKVFFDAKVEGGNYPFEYRWDFDDGKIRLVRDTTHVFEDEDVYTVTFTATDVDGDMCSGSVVIYVGPHQDMEDRSNIYVQQFNFINEDIVRPGDQLWMVVSLSNVGAEPLDDLVVRTTVQDLAVTRSFMIDKLGVGDMVSKFIALDIPMAAESGPYDVRLVVSNDDYSRIRHREFKVLGDEPEQEPAMMISQCLD
ncbi:hypothetical protein JW968_05010, partial [Candidatus Woesearchaeota archaeon]|nr:hypothetical protein [Candidatus Woesearchaeota archaeon]